MQFTTPAFVTFFCLAMMLWWMVPCRANPKTHVLLILNLIFYGAMGLGMLVVMVGISTWTWWGSRWVSQSQDEVQRSRRFGLLSSMLLVHLVGWKYWPWMVIEHNAWAASWGGGLWQIPEWAYPAGLSFMTFHAINWAWAIRHGRQSAVSWSTTLAHIGFFPSILAGPVLKAEEVGGQLATPQPWAKVAWLEGTGRVAMGMVFKWVLSSAAAIQAQPTFSGRAQGTLETWWGVHAYALQIFFDFAGYSLMATGLALLLGFRLTENFTQPYLAVTLQDFWRRWHRSLSFFFRDHVYIGWWGGNRYGPRIAILAAASTLVISGLWHGAAMTFVIWGAWHALGFVMERCCPGRERWPRWLGWALTIEWVCWGWVWFHAPDLDSAQKIFSQAWSSPGPFLPDTGQVLVMTGLLTVIAAEGWVLRQIVRAQENTDHPQAQWWRQAGWGMTLSIVAVWALWAGPVGVPAFIYSGF
jgi:alginate O-acetyltransferase complex protein AlgI